MLERKVRKSDLPLAIGYVRADEFDEVAIAEFRQVIAKFCQRQGLSLGVTYCDQGYDGRQLARPGLMGALEAVRNSPGATLVIPEMSHLSPFHVILSALLLNIHRGNGKVLIVSELESPGGEGANFDDVGESR